MVSASKRKFKEYKCRLQHFANEDDAEHKFNSALEQQTSARSFAMPLHLDHCAVHALLSTQITEQQNEKKLNHFNLVNTITRNNSIVWKVFRSNFLGCKNSTL